jgi:SAM-dependent methyltransferase
MDENKTYSDRDVSYFNRFTSGYSPYLEKDLDVMLGPIDSVMHRLENVRICEIGCASGQFSQALAERYAAGAVSLFGLDIARQVLSHYPYEKICGSAFCLPFQDGIFDLVCLPATLHHLFPLEESLSELHRILAPGGFFYCMEPNYFHPQRYFFMRHAFLYHLYRNVNDVPIHSGELREKLEGLDFEVTYFRFINIYFKNPSMLQRLQNAMADAVRDRGMDKYCLPWFILMAKKC